MKKQTNKRIEKKTKFKAKKSKLPLLTFGNVNPEHGRILTLIVSIVFVITLMTMSQIREKIENPQVAAPAKIVKPTALEKEIKEMVQGYPIEKMTPYILQQEPETAKFLIAIAKKESAWGKRKPVLAGQDCYNYWGFRLKAERMGSGGHTCFDSPQQAVSVIAERIDQLIEKEKIDTPKKMVVWKCGYGCQNRPKDASEIKWIKDVSYYYDELLN